MTANNQPGGTAQDAFVVVVNDDEQHALWQARLSVPPGWRRSSAVRSSGIMSRSECLAAIDDCWQDVTPASVRAGAAARPARVGGGGGGPFVHELFAEQAVRRPDAPAVIAGRARVTYRELDESANRLAHYLGEIGVGPEAVIGVYLERGIDVIRAILAIMKAGGGYLPLDPALPAERLNGICSQVRPAAVIAAWAETFPGTGTRVLPLGELSANLAGRPATAPAARLHQDNLCYAIYTSGSTGDPKAVAVSHGSLACVIDELAGEYEIGDDDRVTQFASIAFDTSIEQVFVALTRGATLMLPPPGAIAPSDLLRGIQRKRVTVLDLTPAYWSHMLAHTERADERLRSVRLMITGGEPADPGICRAALRAAPWARLLNAYGLTETTITSTLFDVGRGLVAADPSALPEAALPEAALSEVALSEVAGVPVGRAVGRSRIMVLDEKLDPVPVGTAGEIYIGGCGVARGYLGRPAPTAARFVPDPGGVPGRRMYRTGDLGRWLAGGDLEVAGRLDRQLKVRGFRVEPGEIESVLAGHPDIDQVSVVASRRSSGDTRLVAYYTPSRLAAAGSAPPRRPAATFRSYLLDRLPGYMIPAVFIARHHLPPSLAHGAGPESKADAERYRIAGDQIVPKQRERLTPTQAGLSVLWARLLQREHVSVADDFFALGGNSLLAAEMLARTRASFGIPADSVRPLTRCLLRDPTLRGFAAAVRDARAGRLSADGDQPEIDFASEARLGLRIRRDGAPSRLRPDWRSPREILLTGATGFLGAHLLSELLATTNARVWCLVRELDEDEALRRIAHAAARYELPALADSRVMPLPGDLAEPRLGLSDAQFRDLARDIDVIYHLGALVNFIYPYQELRAANVAGTREIIRLAGLYRGIPVHYVSTTAVLAGLGVAGVRAVTEETALANPERLRMGYVETKYVAEELLRNAGRAGLPVAIYRPLDIVGSIDTGAWSTSTELCALIRFITDTGLAPDIDLPLDFVPADVCAAAIRYISVGGHSLSGSSLRDGGTGCTYHLASPRHAPLGALVDRLRDCGYQIADVAFGDWVGELARHAVRDPSHPMAAFMPLFVDRDGASGLTVAEMYLAHTFPSYSRSNTTRALAGSGIAFPPVNGRLLDRNIDRLMESGYLPAPSARQLRAHAD
jgi:amino acid adenylation domain-containing protein/thioester reductase-like protein